MISRAALAVFTWVVVEILLLGWAVSVLGWSTVLLGSVAASVLGYGLARRSGSGLVREAIRNRSVPNRAVLRLAGFALIVPGLVSDVVGVLLVVPPVRAVVGRYINARLAPFVPSLPRRAWDAVDVDLVKEDTVDS